MITLYSVKYFSNTEQQVKRYDFEDKGRAFAFYSGLCRCEKYGLIGSIELEFPMTEQEVNDLSGRV